MQSAALLSALLICTRVPALEATLAPDTIEARAQGCSTCHGPRGEGTANASFPRIAGKPAGYLFNQLKNFRDGRRSYPPMNYLLAYLQDDYLRELADYFAAQPATRQAANASAGESGVLQSEDGGRLVTRGDPSRGVPACVLCHGPRLSGIEPAIPGLAGLDSRYVAAQLVSWRVGTRHAAAPDCMHDIASRLSEAQVRSVANWLGGRTPTDPTGAAAAGSWTTPLACGSQP